MQIKETKPWRWIAVMLGLLVPAGALLLRWSVHRPSVLGEKDTLVLADFTNSTGDPVFDGALRQGLAIQLEQSPFLSLISDERIRRTLGLMRQPPDSRPSWSIIG